MFDPISIEKEELMRMNKKNSRKMTRMMTSKALQSAGDFTKYIASIDSNHYLTLFKTNYAYRLKVNSIFNKSN